MSFLCDVCGIVKSTAEQLDQHVLSKHRTAKRIRYCCNFSGCAVTYDNYRALQKHRRTKHQNATTADEEQHEAAADIPTPSDDVEQHIRPNEMKLLVGHFLLQMRAENKLSDKASQHLANNLEQFMADFSNIIKKNLADQLESVGEVTAAALISSPQFSGIFSPTEIFDPFRTIYQQDKFIHENFGLVSPIEIKLGQRSAKRKVGEVYSMKMVDCVGYIVPFLSSLAALLKMPQVAADVLIPRRNDTDFLADVFEGSYCENDVVLADSSSLKIVTFDDEFVGVNPIGTHTKQYKYLAFYYVLCNIRPECRSRLSAIQLLAIARSIDIKRSPHALETLLADFVTGINKLRRGVQFDIDKSTHLLRGGLVAHAADTLASQSIGGFCEGVGKAISPCRTCNIRRDDLKSTFVSDPQLLRTPEEHSDRLRELESDDSQFVARCKKRWGVKCRSPLLDIDGVDITKILIHDPQHVLLEGVDHLILKYSLRYFIEQNFLTLDQINSAIENFEYQGEQLLDKPNRIDQSSLNASKNNLRQTAAGMMNLIFLYPFMWGHRVQRDDEVWRNLELLRKINILSLSPICNNDTKVLLKNMIAEHHFNFVRLFPSAPVTPKMHYMVHLPEQIDLYGPLRHHWTMRFEGKHAQFKAMNIKNHKNAMKTMAVRHQRWICSRMTDSFGNPNPHFLYEGDHVGSGNTELLVGSVFSNEFPNESDSAKIFVTQSVKIHGHSYQLGTILVLELYSPEGAVIPQFGEIVAIGVFDRTKVFQFNLLRIEHYDDHLGAYEVSRTDCFKTIKYFELLFKWPQLKNKFDGKTLVTLYGVPAVA